MTDECAYKCTLARREPLAKGEPLTKSEPLARRAIRRDENFQKAQGEIKNKEDVMEPINAQDVMKEEIKEFNLEPVKWVDMKKGVDQRKGLGRKEEVHLHRVAGR
jgi:hypothetical protein